MNFILCSPDYKSYTEKDYTVIIGSTNNVSAKSFVQKQCFLSDFKRQIKNELSSLEHTNLIMSIVPNRYDMSENSPEKSY